MLVLNSEHFQAGDRFLLLASTWNLTPDDVEVAQFIILDLYAEYWFWPSWLRRFDYRERTLGGGRTFADTLLDFPWPDNAGQAEGIRIWGAILDPEFSQIYGDLNLVTFGFN